MNGPFQSVLHKSAGKNHAIKLKAILGSRGHSPGHCPKDLRAERFAEKPAMSDSIFCQSGFNCCRIIIQRPRERARISHFYESNFSDDVFAETADERPVAV